MNKTFPLTLPPPHSPPVPWSTHRDAEIRPPAQRPAGETGPAGSQAPVHIQSHLCESRAEKAWVKDCFRDEELTLNCSGGFSASILDSLRQAVLVSKALSSMSDSPHLTLEESFRLATLGGAKVLHMSDRIGTLSPEKEFDALLVDVEAKGTPLDIFPEDTEEKIQKFLYNGDDRNILQVFVAGRKVVDQMM
ncbi:putative guanine deaminase-like [Penaeus vannamei]|uniref:Putative guanine deaminase-like n=1 Tax=Penaeus vannamei TaxID=6689 RepID=A0A3R7PTK1_PENVA|nr:putative guanine deaminase-like [Penaeus vannamei]